MANDGDNEAVERWARLITERRHASVFARKTPEDKRVVERATAGEWAESVAAEFGIQIDRLWQPDADPPDIIVEIAGQELSLELVELVDERRLRDGSASKVTRRPQPSPRQKFEFALWGDQRLRTELGALLDRKQSRYRQGEAFDILVVHTDEPWLRAHDVRHWLSRGPFAKRSCFRSAYLLLTYDPNEGPHWPVFRLY